VVGFAHKAGYENEERTPHLMNVGCENCHGPGSLHIENKRAGKEDAALDALMNPWKAPPGEAAPAKETRRLRINDFCRKCHDDDNDVHWDFDKKWPEIDHPTKK